MEKEYIVGTFNLKNDLWNKEWKYEEYANTLANYIQDNKIDFLGCQELVKKYSIVLMNNLLDKYKVFGKYRYKGIRLLKRFDESVGIITKHKPLKVYNKYLSIVPSIPRVMSAIEDENIMFINVHLDYKSKIAKKIELKKLYRFIYKHKDKNIVLLGDFNLKEDNNDFISFVNKMKQLNIDLIDNKTNTFSKRRIDYIFLSNNFELLKIWSDNNLKKMSDHRPIFIKIKIKK